MEQIFIRIYDFFEKRRKTFFAFMATSFLLVGYFAIHVNLEEDISKILPKDKKIEKLNEVFQNSKFMDKLVVMVSLKDSTAIAQPDSLEAYAESFVDKIHNKLNPYISKLNDKVDDDLVIEFFGSLNEHLPIYLDQKDYKSIDSLIAPKKIKETLVQDFKTLTSPAGIALKNMISNDPVGISFLGLKKMQQLQYDENFELYDNYIVTKDRKNLLIFITPEFSPNNTGKNVQMLNGLDEIIYELSEKDFTNINATYFGATAVSVGNALQLRRDSLLTQGITILFIVIFLGIYFRKKRAPFVILVPVLFGALFSLSFIYFIKGSISVIALGTGSVVLGIAVNYSLHVFNHYRHTKNSHQLIKDLALPMTVGSFTTIGGFLCLEFVESEMLKDLGLFAALSLIGASLSSLIFLPQMLAPKNEKINKQPIKIFSFIDKLAINRLDYNKYLVIVIFALTIFFGFWATKVSFESDLNKMNFMSDKLKQAEKKLNKINEFALQSIFIVTEGKNLNQALINNEKLAASIQQLQEKNIVKKYSGVSSIIISDSLQKIRIAQWKKYWTPEKKAALMTTLYKEGAELKFNTAAFEPFKKLLDKNYDAIDLHAMDGVRKNYLDDYITENPGKTTVVTLVKVASENKKLVYNEFEKEQNVTVLDKQYLTGKFVQIINDDFTSIALMTSLLVFFVLLIMYGRIELTLVSFIPMLLSWIWILGIMGILGIQFNIINIIISALIFGLGDDYSLFIMDGLLQEYKTGKKNLASYKSSILLSAITTVAGLGVLIFAKHPALRSIAVISIVGIVCVVIMSQILIPFFFNVLIKNRVRKNLFPWTLISFIKSSFAFSLFILWSIIFTLLGRIFAAFNVKEKGKYYYHLILSKACWFLMNVMINVKKKIINPLNEDFSKPAIIICNHQSSLDIVPLIKMHPKILMVTNYKKWNARFFGPVIRMADYFPAEELELNLELIRDRMSHGYSIVVFPEGTRSEDGQIKRFHKGAFYLAEKLNTDILPIMIHGTNYTLTKKDALLKDGQVTLQFLPRIQPADLKFGVGYAERTKNIGRYFKEEFEILKTTIENTAYFKEKLIYNYIYKGPFLEWYMRIKIRLEKNYQIFHELVPLNGKVLDIGCGYGFMSYMLYFSSNQRIITAIDYDEEKIATAQHCFNRPSTLDFINTDVLNFKFDKYDAIIIADVLHYLLPDEQLQVLNKCIANLNPGGIIIIRDGDKDAIMKHKRTLLTEFFSTKLFKFNKISKKGLSFLSGKMLKESIALQNMEYIEISDSKITSNTIFVIKKKER